MSFVSATEAFAGVSGVRILSSSPDWICLRAAPDLELKAQIVKFFRSYLADDFPADLCDRLCVAMDELLANAMEHGCNVSSRNGHGQAEEGVELTYIRTVRCILLQLRDAGAGFSWKSLHHAAITNPSGQPLRHAEFRSKMGLRPGGFGIMLVRQIADELIYNEHGNEVLFIKYL